MAHSVASRRCVYFCTVLWLVWLFTFFRSIIWFLPFHMVWRQVTGIRSWFHKSRTRQNISTTGLNLQPFSSGAGLPKFKAFSWTFLGGLYVMHGCRKTPGPNFPYTFWTSCLKTASARWVVCHYLVQNAAIEYESLMQNLLIGGDSGDKSVCHHNFRVG